MDAKQNAEIELRAKLAAQGGAYRYQDTPIFETEGAKQTCPYRSRGLIRDGWWDRSEPECLRSLFDRVFRKFARDDRDERSGKERENSAVRDAEPFEEYMPEPEEEISDWLKRLAKEIDVNVEPRRSWWSLLQSFVGKFPPGMKASDLDEKTVRKFVEKICGEGGEKE